MYSTILSTTISALDIFFSCLFDEETIWGFNSRVKSSPFPPDELSFFLSRQGKLLYDHHGPHIVWELGGIEEAEGVMLERR